MTYCGKGKSEPYFRDVQMTDGDPIIDKLEELDRRTSAIAGDLNALQGGNLDFREILCIGDSFLDGWLADTNWADELRPLLGRETIISSYSEGGAGYTAAGNKGHTFRGLLDLAYDDLPQPYPSIIIIVGGINDRNLDNYKAYVKETFDRAHTLWPEAIIVPIMSPTYKTQKGEKYIRFLDACRESASFCITPYTSYTWLLGMSNFFNTDGVHPNTQGQKIIAGKIVGFLKAGADTPGSGKQYINAIDGRQGLYVLYQGDRITFYFDLYKSIGVGDIAVAPLPDWFDLVQIFDIGWIDTPNRNPVCVRLDPTDKTIKVLTKAPTDRVQGQVEFHLFCNN